MSNKLTRIGVDVTVLDYNREGIGQYVRQMLLNIPKAEREKFLLIGHPSLKKTNPELVEAFGVSYITKLTGRAVGLRTARNVAKALKQQECDLGLSTHSHLLPLLYPCIYLIHDISPVLYPHYFNLKPNPLRDNLFKVLFSRALKQAKHIVTISNFTKEEVCKHFNVNENRVSVISAGPGTWIDEKPDKALLTNVLAKFGLGADEYFLAISTISPRKDYETLIEGYCEFVRANPNTALKLVIAGKNGWLYEPVFQTLVQLQAAFPHLRLEEKVIFTGYVDDLTANTLARQSRALVSTSLYEGFGMPPLEALILGKEVIVTDIPIYREIYTDIAHFTPVKDPMALSLNLQVVASGTRILNTPQRRATLKKQYSWGEVAKKLLAAIASHATI